MHSLIFLENASFFADFTLNTQHFNEQVTHTDCTHILSIAEPVTTRNTQIQVKCNN